MIWRLLPLVGAVLFVGVVFCWRPWLQFRRHGTWGIILFRSEHRGQNLRDGLTVALFILLVTAQLHLGASWRIGIEEGATPGLITSGLYRFSRNPIFLALLITVASYAVLLPTRLSLVLPLGTYLGIRQQVAAEEAYLLRAYGDGYRGYARRVGRFLPGVGRLR